MAIAASEKTDFAKAKHKILDPIWKSGRISREELYARLSDQLGWKYHTANIKSIEEARKVYRLVREYAQQGA